MQNTNIKTAMLSSKEKNAKIKYTLKKSNKIIVQIKITKNTFYIEGEYLTSHLYFPCIHTPLWVYVYTKKVDMTSKIFHDALQESFCTKLSSEEKKCKNTLKKSNKIIVQIKITKNTV